MKGLKVAIVFMLFAVVYTTGISNAKPMSAAVTAQLQFLRRIQRSVVSFRKFGDVHLFLGALFSPKWILTIHNFTENINTDPDQYWVVANLDNGSKRTVHYIRTIQRVSLNSMFSLVKLWEPVKLRCFLLDLSYITMNDVNIEAQILGWTKIPEGSLIIQNGVLVGLIAQSDSNIGVAIPESELGLIYAKID